MKEGHGLVFQPLVRLKRGQPTVICPPQQIEAEPIDGEREPPRATIGKPSIGAANSYDVVDAACNIGETRNKSSLVLAVDGHVFIGIVQLTVLEIGNRKEDVARPFA